jgi:hypothetical protein
MRNQPIDVVAIEFIGRERFFDDAIERLHGDFENFASLHEHMQAGILFVVPESGRDADGIPQQFFVAAVRMQMCGKNAGIFGGLEHDGARTIAEQHARRSIRPIDHARQRFRADDERGFDGAASNEFIRDRQSVDKSGTCGVYIERRATVRTQAVLQQTCARWKDNVGCCRPEDDQLDLVRGDACRFHRGARGMFGEIAGRLAIGSQMALTDARARHDPLVAGFDELFEIGIGDDPFRQIAAGTGDAGVDQSSIPQL